MTVNWMDLLKSECGRSSQAAVGRKIGYSAATINMVLKGTYAGNLKAVEKAVLSKLTCDAVACPVLGQITPETCSSHQNAKFSAANSMRVRLFRACRSCQYNSKRKD